MSPAFALLLVAIAIEVAATSALPRADGFTNAPWTIAVVAGYLVSIWMLTKVVEHLSVSVAYAVWSGLGTAAVAMIGFLLLGEDVSALKVTALALIVAGVVMLNLQSTH